MTSPVSWSELSQAFARAVHDAGFEVFGAVAVGAYNESLQAELQAYRLPELHGEHTLVLVVGNTRRLWQSFLASDELANADPLDRYSRAHIDAAAAAVALRFGVAHDVRYSFDPAPDSVAIQRLAVFAGAAELAPIGLCIHPQHGPWISLRAAVVFAAAGPAPRAAVATCSACSARPCLAARARVLDDVSDADFARGQIELPWQDWLAMRDACPVGRLSRYTDPQIRYHYTKDLRILR